jgi:hypothetical protein
MSEHFVKLSHGAIYHFCHNRQGICFCTMTDDKIREYEILLGNGRADFDVLVDDSDTLHLFCQDDTGSILYLKTEEKVWKKHVILQSKTPTSYAKNFNVQRVGSWLNLFYTVEYKGQKMLSHQIIGHSQVPEAVDYILDKFSVAKDDMGNIYVLYTNHKDELGWRKYVWSQKRWEDFVPAAVSGKLSSYNIFVDEVVHVTGVMDNSIMYIGNNCEQVIGSSGSAPIFMKVRGSLYIVWENRRDGKVWASLSNDNGLTFQSPTEFVTGRFAPIKCYHVAATSFEGIKSDFCYGYIRDNCAVLYLLNGFFNVSKTPPRPAVTAAPKDPDVEITKLQIQVKQLSDAIKELAQRLDAIEKENSKSG